MSVCEPAASPPQQATARRRVLFVERTTGFGGSTVGIAHLLRGMDRAQWEPLVVLSHETQRAYLERQGLGWAETTLVPMRPPRVIARSGQGAVSRILRRVVDSPLAAVDSYSRARPYAADLLRFIAGRALDVVHLNNSVSVNRAGIRVARALGVPCVVKQRGFEWKSWDVGRLAQQVDLFLPDSASVAADLVRLGVPRNRIRVTYCAVDVDARPEAADVARARAELGLAEGVPSFGIPAQLVAWKGQDVFLRAAARVLREIPAARAVVVGAPPGGGDSEYAQGLRGLARFLGIEDRVVFAGHRDDVPAVLAALDVVVHASVSPEPFGTVVAEAMALGRPVVASSAGGPAEYVDDGRTGLHHEPGDAQGLAQAILRILRDPAAAAVMAQAGRLRARARFAADVHVRRTFEAYESLARAGAR